MRVLAIAVAAGLAFLTLAPVRADHPLQAPSYGTKHLLWAQWLPDSVASVPYSLCSYDPDGLPKQWDGDEYVPSEYQTALNGWKIYLMQFTPMDIRFNQVAGDCNVLNANLRIGVQTDTPECLYGCLRYSLSDQGSWVRMLSADLYVGNGYWPNMGQWKQTTVYHELGHMLGLADHNPPTQCAGQIMAESGFNTFMLMQQYAPEDGYLTPCAPEPSLYETAAVACSVYPYYCDDLNVMYGLGFGGAFLDGNRTYYIYLLVEVANTYNHDSGADLFVQAWSESDPDVQYWRCAFGTPLLLMPASSGFTMLGEEHRFAIYRVSINCSYPDNGVLLQFERHFLVCISPGGEDVMSYHNCTDVVRGILVI